MTYYAPTSIRQLIETVQAGDPAQRRRLHEEWRELAEALAVLCAAQHVSIPPEWHEVVRSLD